MDPRLTLYTLPLPLLLPIGLVLSLLSLAIILKSRILISSAALLLLLLSTPIFSTMLMRIAEDFQSPSQITDLDRADAVIVLGDSLTSTSRRDELPRVNFQDSDRLFAAVELIQAGKAARLLLSGVTPAETEALKKAAIYLGISPKQIIVAASPPATESGATTHFQQLRPGETVILVAAAAEMPRATRQFLSTGVTVIPFPVSFNSRPLDGLSRLDFIPAAANLMRSETALRELLRRMFSDVSDK
ncbi:MAG: hypothetical protein RL768_1500 [Nitrospirota bacterium]|jgi:uncharacterized SAM-binding protein YcdF (DUF218 family)